MFCHMIDVLIRGLGPLGCVIGTTKRTNAKDSREVRPLIELSYTNDVSIGLEQKCTNRFHLFTLFVILILAE